MELNLVQKGNAYIQFDENGKEIAKITYQPKGDHIVIVDHTYVDPILRGHGIAEKLLDHLVVEMAAEGKKIEATCSYVVEKFKKEPEKYNHINANA